MDELYICRVCNMPFRRDKVRFFSFGCICKNCMDKYFVPIEFMVADFMDKVRVKLSCILKAVDRVPVIGGLISRHKPLLRFGNELSSDWSADLDRRREVPS